MGLLNKVPTERAKGRRDAFYGCEKNKKTFWRSDLFVFKRQHS